MQLKAQLRLVTVGSQSRLAGHETLSGRPSSLGCREREGRCLGSLDAMGLHVGVGPKDEKGKVQGVGNLGKGSASQ